MSRIPLVKAELRKGPSRMGFAPYWVVDKAGNLLHTEPVCLVPDGWHDWFKSRIEAMEFDYWGVAESPAPGEAAQELEEGTTP